MEVIKVSKRDFSMKAKKLRSCKMVPGSVFGGALKESVSLQMDEATARRLVSTMRIGSRVKLDLEGQIIPVQIKSKEVSPLSNAILTIDFQALKADQKANSVAHVVLLNTDKVTDILEHMVTDIPYAALPADMIDTIDIDVDGMGAGTTVTVGDIKELNNDKIDLQVDKDEIVLRIVERKQTEEEEETEQEAE